MTSEDASLPSGEEDSQSKEELQLQREKWRKAEWRELAEDLKSKAYLAEDTNVDEFVAECATYIADEWIGDELIQCSHGSNATVPTLLTGAAVLVREAVDYDLSLDAFPSLSRMSYPIYEKMPAHVETKKSLQHDIDELSAWIANMIEGRQNVSRNYVDTMLLNTLRARLSELVILCYFKFRGATPRLEEKLEKKKQKEE